MEYKLVIIAKNNMTDYREFVLKPKDLNVTQDVLDINERSYWDLPKVVNNKNVKVYIRKLLNKLFTKRIVTFKNDKFYQISGYNWNNTTMNYSERSRYNFIKPDEKKQFQDLIAKGRSNILMIKLSYFINTIDSTKLKKQNTYCKYHMNMLSALTKINKKNYIYYDKRRDSFNEEDITKVSSNKIGGNKTKAYKKSRKKRPTMRKNIRKRSTRRRSLNGRLHNKTRKI